MKFRQYVRQIERYQPDDYTLSYLGIGLSGKIGKFNNSLRQYLQTNIARQCVEGMDDRKRDELIYHLSEILHYLSMASTKLGINLEDLAHKSILTVKSKFDIFSDIDV